MSQVLTYEQALAQKRVVADSFSLKEAVKRGDVMIVSTDAELYSQLLERFNKQSAAKTAKTTGGIIAALGVGIALITTGLFIPAGAALAVAGVGAAGGIAGMVLDDYKDYAFTLDFDNKNIIFLKIKGSPRVKQSEVKELNKKLSASK